MKKVLLSCLLVSLVLAAGCAKTTVKRPEAPAQELSEISLKLKWLHQAQFAGNYVAQELGLYEKNGIKKIKFIPYNYESLPIDAIENKEADFGIAGGDELIAARAAGKAEHVKAIAVIYKIGPKVFYSLKGSGIITPKDIVGKTVGLGVDSIGIFNAFCKKTGIDQKTLTIVDVGYDYSELLSGEVDISEGYLTNVPKEVLAGEVELNTILLADYGLNMYGDIIIAHVDTINNRPETVKNFLAATFAGWQYAIENEDEAIDIVMRYAPESDRKSQEYMLKSSIPLIHTGDSYLGLMEKQAWENMYKLLLDQGVISGELDIKDIYSMEFLNKVYSK